MPHSLVAVGRSKFTTNECVGLVASTSPNHEMMSLVNSTDHHGQDRIVVVEWPVSPGFLCGAAILGQG